MKLKIRENMFIYERKIVYIGKKILHGWKLRENLSPIWLVELRDIKIEWLIMHVRLVESQSLQNS